MMRGKTLAQKTTLQKCRAHESRSGKITEAKNEQGLGPKGWPSLEVVRHFLVVADHEEREERVTVMVLESMVVLFGGGDGF